MDVRSPRATLLTASLVCVVACSGKARRPDAAVNHDASVADAATEQVSQFHTAGSSTPGTCLPCHADRRPTSTAGWRSTTYAASPFDFGTNGLGVTHGAGQDCAVCHTGPGTGAWGQRPDWVGGHFAHAPLSLAERTCIACHLSQRPDLQPGTTPAVAAALVGFDHAPLGTMDCIGCHSATVAAASFVHYLNPVTATLPGGDWQGGQSYPGARPVGFPGERIELATTTLTLSAAGDRVLGATTAYESLQNVMIHTSPAVPPELRPGPVEAPDYGKCWHCHVNKDGVVTMFPMGKFHHALAQYTATPEADPTPLPQPTRECRQCHASAPTGVIARSTLQPMSHGAVFAAPVSVGGVAAAGVADLDCSTCHKFPTGIFADGVFHEPTAAATPRDCVSCHYVTMADETVADVQSGAAYRMRHLSAQVPFHACTRCHPGANATRAAVAAESWRPGHFHSVLAVQPTACGDCHAVSAPATHAAVTRDCAECHAYPGTGTAAAPNWSGATQPL